MKQTHSSLTLPKRPGAHRLAALLLASPMAWAATPQADANVARGVLRAEREAVLSSSVSERIVRMPYREGDHFKKGAALVTFDCGRLSAQLRAARAAASVEARNAKVQSELLAMDATGRADADIAVLKEKERNAQADVISQSMVGCKVGAPYNGRVVETMVRPNETPPANEKLIKIVSDGPLELHMVVPSKWLQWLHKGSTVAFKIDETGDTLQAKVQRISAAVDAVSQTVKVVASVDKAPAKVRPGMSGRALLEGTESDPAAASGAASTVAGTAAQAAQ
ncbi:efflux RND transporter periplasmic adaptor subunit [Variovorax sp. LARHSF232]